MRIEYRIPSFEKVIYYNEFSKLVSLTIRERAFRRIEEPLLDFNNYSFLASGRLPKIFK